MDVTIPRARPFSISNKQLWFLEKEFHELGKIVNNYNLETYRVIKIINLSADWILVHLYPYCEKRSYVRAENLTADIQSFKWLTSTSIRNQLPLFKD